MFYFARPDVTGLPIADLVQGKVFFEGNAMGKVIREKREREADVLPMINKTTLSTPT